MKIKKGDKVKIISGKDKGKEGKVIKILQATGRISVEGINVYKKHVRPKRQEEKGEVVSVTRPFSFSNVMLVCPACGKATRGAFSVEDAKKTRICKKCGATI
ncbi:MAG: 50S ribosomal protein L24 [Candidatus Jorgensenbacteria bacterium GW2011_GWA2_45_13]|uniref:Large ribosomal subunit protein uL24 n=1 Tax=Candidatus Jorgensenbacteria bacterium GW2011_GWA2_45_13 TaxID=1618662 RepID=A0A0G1NCN7_9BACT|nr:MAG: 50S ribosomal protein L24 [Candidatus Jorgensenbacteria bacterium GW2011_GWA2_45_13]